MKPNVWASFISENINRYERYLAWYDKYVRKMPVEAKPMVASWEGKWRGNLTNVPAKAGATPVEVTMEIGAFPASNNSCTMWKTTYSEGGVEKSVKNYQLCRGTGATDLYIDEGGGVRLPATVIGDALVSPFKFDNTLLVSTMRLRGEVLEQEILTVDDKPAVKGVQPMTAKGTQRIELRRAMQ